MSLKPKNNLLATRIRSLALQNQPATTDQVVFLGPRGEVLSARYPIRGDAGGLLAERADLSESGRLSAVVYLSPAPEWFTVQLALVEFYDDGQRTVQTVAISPGTINWFKSSEQRLDLWIDQFREEDNRSTQQ